MSVPQKINSRHRVIMRLLASGMSNLEVAEAVGCTAQTVCNAKSSPMFQAELELLQVQIKSSFSEKRAEMEAGGDARQVLLGAQLRAAQGLVGMIDAPSISPGMRMKAQTEVLDRTGLQKIEKIEVGAKIMATEGLEQMLLANLGGKKDE